MKFLEVFKKVWVGLIFILIGLSIFGTYASTQSWYTGARLISGKYLTLNSTGAEGNASDHTFDSNTGWQKSGYNTTHQSWMWKRHAGFDVVTWKSGDLESWRLGELET